MSAIISSTCGRDGRAVYQSPTRELVSATREWLEGEISLDDLRATEACLPQRRNLALVVNNECNLSCTHCFLQIPSLAGKRLAAAEWQRVLESAMRENVEQFLLVGKEVLLGRTGPEVVSMLGAIRSRRSSLRTGIITNGTLLHKHLDVVQSASLNHMDISMEGDATDHDAVRGAGAFAALRSNVEWAVWLLGEQLFVTLTHQKRNNQRLDKALMAFAEMGIQSVGISPFEKLSYTDTSLALSAADYRFFFDHLSHLEQLPLPHEMLVQIDTCAFSPEMLVHFIESDWFDLDAMQMDGTGFMYASHRLDNGLTLSFRFLPWPLAVDFHTRISADGAILCAADGYLARAYHVNSLANIRDFDFDFGAAYRAACMHPRLEHIDSNFEAETTPRIRAAYRRHLQARHAGVLPAALSLVPAS